LDGHLLQQSSFKYRPVQYLLQLSFSGGVLHGQNSIPVQFLLHIFFSKKE
jgi:hypothetical protein